MRTSPADFGAVARQLRRLARDARALRAVGAIDVDTTETILAECELAFLLRGSDWLELVLTDLPSLDRALADGGRTQVLEAVLGAGDMAVEIWRDELVVRTAGASAWRMPGGIPADQERLEIRTSAGVGVFDLTRAVPVRQAAVVAHPPTFDDLLVAWGIVSELLPLPRRERAVLRPDDGAFEVLATCADGMTLTALERGEVMHGEVGRPALAWLVSDDGIHVLREGLVIEPPLPPSPSPVELVLLDAGIVRRVALRPDAARRGAPS